MKYQPTATNARISEIFSSLQGEGTLLGENQIFLRFEECHIHCQYCDELDKKGRDMSIEETLAVIDQLEKEAGPHGHISFTGGEPLLYTAFLETLVPLLRERGHKMYLETDGILWKTLEKHHALFDFVSMDLKPASVTGERNFDVEHAKFLEVLVREKKDYYLKIVVSKQIKMSEFEDQIKLVKNIAPDSVVVLQPMTTAVEGHEDKALMQLLGEMQKMGLKQINHVRIVPRFHKIIGIR